MNTDLAELTEVVTAERFATIKDGKIVTICDCRGTPPQELKPCQISLTKQEFELLDLVHGRYNPDEMIELAQQIKAKLNANGS